MLEWTYRVRTEWWSYSSRFVGTFPREVNSRCLLPNLFRHFFGRIFLTPCPKPSYENLIFFLQREYACILICGCVGGRKQVAGQTLQMAGRAHKQRELGRSNDVVSGSSGPVWQFL